MIASKTLAALIRSASARVLVIDERSPGSAPAAPGTPANACSARASSRACRTTSCPPRTSCVAASRPSPSAEPVISTLDIRRAPSPPVSRLGFSTADADKVLVFQLVRSQATQLAAEAGPLGASERELGAICADDVHVDH